MFDQIAVVCRDIEASISSAKAAGLKEWTRDQVTAQATIIDRDGPVTFRAKLGFNYDIMEGVEFEFIQPLMEGSYIDVAGKKSGDIAHAGIHVADEAEAERWKTDLMLAQCLQDCVTQHHSNPAVPDNRRYHYSIWWTSLFPFPVKLIERLEVAGG